MVNSQEFIDRLKKIITHYELTASLFADKIGVQRSSISHILSGRNKPSLDFVLKIVTEFEDVDIYWLLNGKGTFPKRSTKNSPTETVSQITKESIQDDRSISRIVVFYNDGTFSEYFKR